MEHLKTLQQEAPKWFRKQEIIKLWTEIQKEKQRKMQRNEAKSLFFEKINSKKKHLYKLTKRQK